jgi:hypothetical protein
VNIRQSESTALEIEGESFVIQAKAVENRCLKVVNVDGIFDDMKAEIIGFSISESPSYSPACQPHRVRLGVVVSSERSAKRRIVFNHGRSPKLATPDDEGGIEQAAFFEVVDECG